MKAQIKSKLNLDKRVELQNYIPIQTPFLLYVDPSSACNFSCQFCPSGHKDIYNKAGNPRRIMSYQLFEKIINDLNDFESSIKVLRMNKIGEPFTNKNLAKMISTAKNSGRVEYIDLATNGSLFTYENLGAVIEAGLDRINISIEGINKDQYIKYAGYEIDFEKLIKDIKWLYLNRGNCEVTIKVPSNYLTELQKVEFYDLFGNYCDRIFIEDIAPIWPSFDLESNSVINVTKDKGQYTTALETKDICTYIFYSLAINADGSVSACCPDWKQKLIIGNVEIESVKDIWNSEKMNVLRLQHLEGFRQDNEICGNCGHLAYSQVDNIDPYREMILQKIKSSIKKG